MFLYLVIQKTCMKEVLPVLVASFIEDGFQLQPALKAPPAWLISHVAHPDFGHDSQSAATLQHVL